MTNQITQIRHANLLKAIANAGGQSALAELAGLSPVYLSQVKNKTVDTRSGKEKQIGSDACRAIERALKVPVGWMDTDHEKIELSPQAMQIARLYDSLSTDEQARIYPILIVTLHSNK